MEFDNEESKLGSLWFIFAGAMACCLAFFIATVDYQITYSDAEKVKGDEIRAVRTAQASLPTGPIDARMK